MVTVLCQRAKNSIRLIFKSQNLNPIAMAWRSIGSDNADLINQLEGMCIYIIVKYRAISMTTSSLLLLFFIVIESNADLTYR